jgi:hypothetical protein
LRFFVSACNVSNQVVVRALGPLYTDPAQLIIQQLRRIGMRGTLRTMESTAGFAAYVPCSSAQRSRVRLW